MKTIAANFFKHYKILLLGATIAVIALAANLGIMAVSAWFITTAAIAGTSLLTAQAYNHLSPGTYVRGFALTRTLGKYLERIVTHEATFRVLADVRTFFFKLLAPRLPAKGVQIKHAELYQRMVTDVEALEHLYLRLFVPLCMLFAGAVILAALIIYSEAYSLFYALSVLAWGICLIAWAAYKYNYEKSSVLVEQSSQVRNTILNNVAGFRDMSLYGVQSHYSQQLNEQVKAYHEAVKVLQLRSFYFTALAQLLALFTLVITTYTAVNLTYTQELTTTWVVIFALVILALTEAILPIPVAFQFFGKMKQSVQRILDIQTLPMHTRHEQAEFVSVKSAKIMLENVTFKFQDKTVLDNVSLEIESGSKVALVGASGEGKSTVLNLVSKLWEPDSGTISIGGHDVALIKTQVLNNMVAFASQKVHIFADTLRQNLLIANPEATDKTLHSVLSQVQLGYLLEQQGGLEQWLGEGGRALSGGEQRRIEIARLLLRESQIVLLDEVTEGLDKATEQHIIHLLNDYLVDKTVIEVTHRLTALSKHDQIWRLHAGQISRIQ